MGGLLRPRRRAVPTKPDSPAPAVTPAPWDLDRRLAESLARESALAEVLRVMSRTPLDLQAVFDTVIQRAAELCSADRDGSLFLIDGERYRFAAGTSVQKSPGLLAWREGAREYQPVEMSFIVKHVVRARAPFHVRDAAVDGETERYREESLAFGMRTCLGVPLMRDDKVVGVLSLTRQEVRPFAPHEIDLVRAFADQAAIAIENTRLFDETKAALDQQTAVSEVLKTISDSAFDLQRVLETLVEQAARLCDAERGSIYRKDWPLFRTAAMWGPNITDEYRRLAVEARAPNRGSLVGRTALEGKVVHIVDVLADPEYTALDLQRAGGFRTVLGVPLMRDEVVLGVFVLHRPEVRPFTERQIDLVRTFADQAVIAMENVRLFNETREALERQTATGEILRSIASSPNDLQPVLDTIAGSAARFCGASDVTVWLARGDELVPAARHGELP